MATVSETQQPSKAFYAILDETNGALTKVHGTLYFVTEDDVIEIEPQHMNFLVVLGAMQKADAQHLDDVMNRGYAGVACSRQQLEV